MSTINLTEKEMKVMKLCLNYDNKYDQLDDNFSDVGPKDVMDILSWSKEQVGGVISSLEKKELVYSEQEEQSPISYQGSLPATLWLTEKGINAYFDYKGVK